MVLGLIVCSAQIITPAHVISNSNLGIKVVKEEERTTYKDFRLKSVSVYSKKGFPITKIELDMDGMEKRTTYSYSINEDDSTMTITQTIAEPNKEVVRTTLNYRYTNGSLWEWTPVDGDQPVTFYKHYQYDHNWNLTEMDEVKVIGADSSIVKRHRYIVQTDVFNRVVTTNHTQYDMPTYYYYDEDGTLLSTAIFDGQVKRSSQHRLYNNDLLELSVNVLNRGGALLGIHRYSYKTYGKGKRSIFETWKPVKHMESVMQER